MVELDLYNEGYLTPNDMLWDHPFVYGIKMSELEQVIADSHKTLEHVECAMVILDCCYSGIATAKGAKEGPPEGNEREIYLFKEVR